MISEGLCDTENCNANSALPSQEKYNIIYYNNIIFEYIKFKYNNLLRENSGNTLLKGFRYNAL